MKSEILEFLQHDILSGQAEDLQSGDDLLSTETIDSMGVMRLIGFIEEKFGIKVPAEDVTIDHFLSVDTICDYLTRRTEAASR